MSTVLVVDDNIWVLEFTSNLLIGSGLNVMQASDGVETLDQIQANCPDLVLLDIVMPRLNGYEVCRLIKANPKTWHIPVIFTSTKTEIFDIYWGMKQGATAYIGIPFHPIELVETVKRVLWDTRTLHDRPSADDWIKYGILVLNTIKLYNHYELALSAFEEALKLDPNRGLAHMYRDTVQQQVEERRHQAYIQQQLEERRHQAYLEALIEPAMLMQTTCKGCMYYHGRDGLICAVHPDGPDREECRDWESN